MSQPSPNAVSSLKRLLVACAAIGLAASAQATTLDTIKENSRIRIGYANETPFAFTETDGRVTGESPEIAKVIFQKMGIKQVDGVLTEWGSLIPGLRAGRFDVIAAGMYITPARCKQVIFTDPQYALPDTLLVAAGNPKGLHSYADIAKNPDVKLAIMAGTVNLAYARESGVKDEQILQVPDTTAQLQAVRAGRADAAVGTQLTMKGLAKKGGDKVQAITDFTDDPSHTGYGALAFRPEDKDLRDAVNAELKRWLGSEEHLKTVAPFGFDRSNVTDKTAAELCAQQ
ncbi:MULTISPECIES: ectoine/hydroxyectoine ABC transporter substrate-binding protein EhuB [Pseudomonas]|jgi:polar amino acid transport system substrate-binding protein|uniref:Ectoine/hydroxyectoine ABC transporter substrate-binding protein EhuB n=2 Tax=Gammaproteobacteria TaxID=1236 RepID=A0AAX0VSR3_9PSED|nr:MULTISPECIES: ectoine/hydroxyectoine ABC transporter substrate-binding protein EhuB [Pseudomonas]MBH3358421.1 ectoine/hydroxyectoine ABC transporter substrate-binding protein EhuB [Pseudomonas guariconensis]MCO7623739.1 ectoine/hydroxyectoine ABC transporter substrate-binding protein EhuB [Pseudomonas guariconensis]MDM9594850.1 ectoine/hydroxyectoine ABC transporter substrate-binding protein EhuB [Pseudomonas guariconensis]MDM9607681.1 ectoine/hydroxyectoine ABC transporter substrate-binding